eukprot:SAG31_NODE_43435_length_267_cov_0.613095_1_plen_24_part_01
MAVILLAVEKRVVDATIFWEDTTV